MGYRSLQLPDLYDAIYLHTHPRDKRVLPNSISDYIHADAFRFVSTLVVGNGIPIEFESIGKSNNGVDQFEVDGQEFSLERTERERIRSRERLRRNRSNADDAARALNRIFVKNVKNGHERVALRISDGMLITYERNRPLNQRLNEVYRDASLHLPTGGCGFESSSDIAHKSPSDTPRPLGY